MTQEEIRAKALALLSKEPKGVRLKELAGRLKLELPDIIESKIYNALWNLDQCLSNQIYKPARGLFQHVKFKEQNVEPDIEEPEAKEGKREKEFYGSFAKWLETEIEECTKAKPLGGNVFKDKWGTPDVVGVRKPQPSDVLKFPIEIVSAEMKTNPYDLIKAFGQACSYSLFSHKVYLVVPRSSPEDDLAHLDALCLIFGIGLIQFNADNPKEPNYEIRARAAKHDPDMFYVNKNLKVVADELLS